MRAQRITELLDGKLAAGPVSFGDMQAIRADVVLPDAQFFVPLIAQALARARTSPDPLLAPFALQPGVVEAVGRLSSWKLTAPTGIAEGFDAADVDGVRGIPTDEEVAESVAARIYSVWRGQFIRNTIDTTLGGRFSVPPAFGALPHPLGPSLPGLPADGGFGAVDASNSNHDPRAQDAKAFMFGNGPVNRFVAEAGRPAVRAESDWPGGTGGIPGTEFHLNLLPRHLTNDTVPLLFGRDDPQHDLHGVLRFVPAN